MVENISELFIPITEEEIGEVISEGPIGYPAPDQHGPLRWCEKEMRCASRGCSSPTFSRLQNIPYCMMHSLRKMNEMLLELGIEQ